MGAGISECIGNEKNAVSIQTIREIGKGPAKGIVGRDIVKDVKAIYDVKTPLGCERR